MISRALTRRLEWLEEKVIPMGPPKVIDIVFINPDRTQAPGGFTFTIPFYPQQHAWQRGATTRRTRQRT
jgi:hypothetical protein